MKVLAVDIGFHNMGLVFAEFEDDPKIHVRTIKKASLDDYKYVYSNDMIDLILLFVEDHRDLFDSADKILIERQPPTGFTNIEILLHYMFKDKVILISPISMHVHFGIRELTYDERKERTVSIAEKYIDGGIPYERKHDIADALCMIVYYNFKTTTHAFDRFKFNEKKAGEDLEKFRFDRERHFC